METYILTIFLMFAGDDEPTTHRAVEYPTAQECNHAAATAMMAASLAGDEIVAEGEDIPAHTLMTICRAKVMQRRSET